MTAELMNLISRARTELGSEACRAGRHTWGFEGGRACPHDLDDNCSQAVYVCIVCGAQDYGEPSGPADDDCNRHCHHKAERAVAIILSRQDPFDLVSTSTTGNQRLYHRMLLRTLRRQRKPRLP